MEDDISQKGSKALTGQLISVNPKANLKVEDNGLLQRIPYLPIVFYRKRHLTNHRDNEHSREAKIVNNSSSELNRYILKFTDDKYPLPI